MRDVVIVGAARTPIGSFLGSLASVPATRLGAIAIQAALERAKVAPADVNEVLMGCVLPAGLGQAPARQAALGAGLPQSVPCTTINKVCGSGLKSVVLGAQSIALGDADIVVAGGMESMSGAPHLVKGARGGFKMGAFEAVDSMIVDGLWDVYTNQHMGNCAELCARERKISRKAQDDFAAESYRRAQASIASGAFRPEIVPVSVKGRDGEVSVDVDEEPGRGDIDKLPKLRTAFDKEGTVTAGNASSLNDGGAAVVLMAADVAKARGATVLGRVVGWAQHAQAPEWFTTAPAAAIEKACKKAGWEP
jgi:acetyl-CoA C-acetyltransferase